MPNFSCRITFWIRVISLLALSTLVLACVPRGQYQQSSGISVPQAQDYATAAPVGAWVVRRGYVRTVYAFAHDGSYIYQRTSPTRDDEETGTYVVQGDSLILTPNGKPQQVLSWWIGTDSTAVAGEPILWLVDSYGRKEKFYPQR